MSAEEKFAQVFSENDQARGELLEILDESADTGVLSDEQVEAIVACAARYDIDITEGEISDDELDDISGGVALYATELPVKAQLIQLLTEQGLLAGLNAGISNNLNNKKK